MCYICITDCKVSEYLYCNANNNDTSILAPFFLDIYIYAMMFQRNGMYVPLKCRHASTQVSLRRVIIRHTLIVGIDAMLGTMVICMSERGTFGTQGGIFLATKCLFLATKSLLSKCKGCRSCLTACLRHAPQTWQGVAVCLCHGGRTRSGHPASARKRGMSIGFAPQDGRRCVNPC